jgi:hypothetical protein
LPQLRALVCFENSIKKIFFSGPRFGDLTDRLEKMSYFTDESSHSTSTTDNDKVTARPPRASDFRRGVGLPAGGGRFMDVPSSSKSSSRSNVSPFGRTPPSSSPNVRFFCWVSVLEKKKNIVFYSVRAPEDPDPFVGS